MQTSELSSRERQVLLLASYGLRNSDIAERLDLSVHTVKNFFTQIYNKMNIAGGPEIKRSGAVAKALREGIIE